MTQLMLKRDREMVEQDFFKEYCLKHLSAWLSILADQCPRKFNPDFRQIVSSARMVTHSDVQSMWHIFV